MDVDITVALIQLTLTLAAAGFAIVPAVVKMRHERKKAEAETAGIITDSAIAMVKRWESRMETLEAEVLTLNQHLAYWQKGCTLLIEQLTKEGIQPCWDPNGGPDKEKTGERNG